VASATRDEPEYQMFRSRVNGTGDAEGCGCAQDAYADDQGYKQADRDEGAGQIDQRDRRSDRVHDGEQDNRGDGGCSVAPQYDAADEDQHGVALWNGFEFEGVAVGVEADTPHPRNVKGGLRPGNVLGFGQLHQDGVGTLAEPESESLIGASGGRGQGFLKGAQLVCEGGVPVEAVD